MTLNKMGRRIYFQGFPFSTKDKIKEIGGRWDAERKEWWVGVVKESEALALLSALASAPPAPPREGIDPGERCLVGRVRYEGRTYYALYLRPGTVDLFGVEVPPASKLVFTDGSKAFWAKGTCEVIARYKEKRSLDQLKAFADRRRADLASAAEAGQYECLECGARYSRPGAVEQGGMGCVACG
jgi:hypothetical protein